jgi:superfamily II DNA or RNA helicase
MPCGTGKSLTAYWITQSLASKATIIAVPSLALIKQSLEDWTKEMLLSKTAELPEWCCICSDESTGQLTDDFVTDTYSLGIPTTTNEEQITSFLKRKTPGGKIIFTTYQSADKLAQVSRRLKFKFDLAILDEAHKTVGAKDKAFSILLQEDKISIGKRLFMTATERIVKGAEDEILSMDDDMVYGKVFYKLSFKKAIEDGIITDYKIVTVLVNDTEIQDLIKKNKYVTDYGKKVDEAEAQMLTTAIALKKAIKEYNINHTVSFHKSINASKEFQSLYQKIDTSKASPTVFHISSKLNAGARAELLKDFRNTSNAIITNARCLTEGVDVPAIDCVLFADQKQSIVDIVQASGRALRQYTDKNTGVKKEVGYIIIPVVLKEGESLDDLTESSRFKTVIRIVTSLSIQDETIAEELKLIDSGKQKTGSGKIQVIGTVNKSIKLNLATFSLKISTKIWERLAKVNFLPFKEARAFVQTLKLKNRGDWRKYSQSGNKPFDIPLNPDRIYPNEFDTLGDWLGTGTIAPQLKIYKPYNEAIEYVHKLNLTSQRAWQKYASSGLRPFDIPSDPWRAYNKNAEFKNWGEWLGTYTVADSKRSLNFLPFIEARIFARSLNLTSGVEWLNYHKEKKLPNNIPTHPESVYKNKGWIGMGDWLGTNRVANQFKSFTNYKNASKYAASLNLKSKLEWHSFLKSRKKPSNIPSIPEEHYKDNGWISWPDWLGTIK